jgi:hypothetical protein
MECEGRLDGQRKSTYGFKAHTNVDEDELIKSTDYTPGNVFDSNCLLHCCMVDWRLCTNLVKVHLRTIKLQ